MNPLSITLRNFLCFGCQEGGEPYVFNFRDHKLWSICGNNGAGKSAIFDAITYCLYGEHRGGKQRDTDLVHQGANETVASFEFDHGGKEYRVTRTIRLGVRPRKGTPTVQKTRRMEVLREDGEWVEVADTSSDALLEQAVEKVLGFGCETLTASALLLQGKSDKLIDAGGKGRFEILSGILDLSRFEKLAEKARERARDARARHQMLTRALDEAPPPDEAEVQAAEQAATDSEAEAARAAAAKADALRTLDAAATYWGRIESMGLLRGEESEMVEALLDSETITTEAAEAAELGSTLPRLRKALEREKAAADAEAGAKALREEAEAIDIEKAEGEAADAELARRAAGQALAAVMKRAAEVRSELAQMAPDLEAAKQLDRLDAELKSATEEVAELNTKCAGVGDLRAEVERLGALEAARPLVGSYLRARVELADAAAKAPDGDPQAELERRQTRRREVDADVMAAGEAVAEAGRALSRADADLERAERTLREREAAGAEGTCSHCGQKVEPSHIRKEIAAASVAVGKARETKSDAELVEGEAAARRDEAQTTAGVAKLAEEEAAGWAEDARRARTAISSLEGEDSFQDLQADLVALLRGPLVDLRIWAANLQSKLAPLRGLRRQLADLSAIEARAAAKAELAQELERKLSELLRGRTRGRLSAARERGADLQAGLGSLAEEEADAGEAAEEASAAAEAAKTRFAGLKDDLQRLGSQAAVKDQEASGAREAAAAALTGVADRFLPVTEERVAAAETRLAGLDGATDRVALLRRAESDLKGLRGRISQLQGDIDATPGTHQVALDDAKQAVTTTETRTQESLAEARARRRAADEVARSRRERLESRREADVLAMRRAVWEKVAQLMGRGGIQAVLMKGALEEIQERANEMLTRISGGQLELSVSFEEGRGGVEEIYFRCLDASSAKEPLDVQFLSGGQRFRCAVALAAGIGLRADSGGSMPSQIIDEGFGSLDSQGRTEMLEEVRLMSEFFERVIVVSHLENFQDDSRFPARFELRKEGTETVVTVVG